MDLFTSNTNGSSETHAVFGGSGQISGQGNRFEFISTGASMGNYYSTFSESGIHRFDRGETEHGRLGTNNNWRFGRNTSGPVFGGLNAARKVEVVDNQTQFRLTHSLNSSGPFTDFWSNASGNLQIMPSGQRVGVNLTSNPTTNLDVNGNMRVRNVQAAAPNSLLVGVNANGASDVHVRRLDFNGNANTFLGGDGQFHTVNATPPGANNGVSRFTLFNPNAPYTLGDFYTATIFNTNTPLTVDRQVRLNNHNLVFSGDGNIGIGLNYPQMPTEVLDVEGNARLRRLPNASYMADNTVDKVVMVDSIGVLKWIDRDSLGGKLGSYCSEPANPLIGDYNIPLNNNNLYFENNDVLGQNHIGIGYNCSNPLSAKLSVQQVHPSIANTSTIALSATINQTDLFS